MRSRNLQSRMIATILILFCCTLFPLQPVKYLSADPSGDFFNSAIPDNEETRKLLEQTLSSAEIEREIIKITAEQKALEQKVESLNRQATQKKQPLRTNRNGQVQLCVLIIWGIEIIFWSRFFSKKYQQIPGSVRLL